MSNKIISNKVELLPNEEKTIYFPKYYFVKKPIVNLSTNCDVIPLLKETNKNYFTIENTSNEIIIVNYIVI